MDHSDHLYLLRNGIPFPGGVWAELGSGSGAFTLALAELVGSGARLYSIDKDSRALHQQEEAVLMRFGQAAPQMHYQTTDFTRSLNLPPLDGLLMANALHFIHQKNFLLTSIIAYLRPGGRFILVEYDTDRGNPWVPYPLSYRTWERMAAQVGLEQTRQLARRPSRFMESIYSALSVKPEEKNIL
jgi:SAM-dependent methyltransferase